MASCLLILPLLFTIQLVIIFGQTLDPELLEDSFQRPELCKLQPDFGSCKANKSEWRWWFNTRGDFGHAYCVMFEYSGCGGNSNNFLTEADCKKACEPPEQVYTGPGPQCNNRAIGKWYLFCADGSATEVWNHNNDTQSCEPIIICTERSFQKKKQDFFQSRQECASQCGDSKNKIQKEICSLPLEPGHKCKIDKKAWWRQIIRREPITRFYYDPGSNTCKKFVYTGCGGNQNNFETSASCYEYCSIEQ